MRMLAVSMIGLSVISTLYSAELYTITDLGPGSAFAINNQGTVLGQSSEGPFLYQGGQIQYLPQPAGGTFQAGAINDLGEVAGTTNFGSGYQYYLTTYVNGALTVNTALSGFDPVAINNAGQITGVEVFKYQSFFYSGGTLTDIPSQPNAGEPVSRAMNSSGVVTGVFLPSSSSGQQVFVYSNGQFTPLAIPGTFAIVGSINDSGVIAGSYGTTPDSLLTAGVFVYDATGFHSLGPALASSAAEEDGVGGINNSGVIVGGSQIAASPYNVAWAYFPGSGFMNLNDLIAPNSGWSLQGASGINNAGDIVGEGTIDGRTDAFLLTPVPEPGTLLLFVGAVIPLVSFRCLFRRAGLNDLRRW